VQRRFPHRCSEEVLNDKRNTHRLTCGRHRTESPAATSEIVDQR
jgi:hypothetical protein